MVEANVLHQNRRCHLAETIIQLEIATVKLAVNNLLLKMPNADMSSKNIFHFSHFGRYGFI